MKNGFSHSRLRFGAGLIAIFLGALPASAQMRMPMLPASHGAGDTCRQAALRCAGTVTPAFAPDGALWLAFDVGDRVFVAHSPDRSAHISQPVQITPGKVNLDMGPDSRAALAIDGKGRVFVAYAVFKDNDYNGEVFFSRSLDGGKHFSPPRPIIDNTASQRFATLTVGPSGNLFAAWLDKRGVVAAQKKGRTYAGAALSYAWSGDGGAHFSPSRIAKDNTCECCRLGVGFAGPGKPVVAFRNIFSNGTVRDHAIITFAALDKPGPAARIAVDHWQLMGCPHQGPSLAISPAGTYHTVWFTQGDARKGVFYARSTDAGAHFSKPMALDSDGHELSRPYITALAGAVWMVWKDFDGQTMTIRARVSHDDGATWSKPRIVAKTSDASDHPMLVNDGRTAYLSWMTKVGGYKFQPLKDGG